MKIGDVPEHNGAIPPSALQPHLEDFGRSLHLLRRECRGIARRQKFQFGEKSFRVKNIPDVLAGFDGTVELEVDDPIHEPCADLVEFVMAVRPEKASALKQSTDFVPSTRRFSLAVDNAPAIVVLPFTPIGRDPEGQYFADGLAEEISTELSALDWLFVISRHSYLGSEHREDAQVARHRTGQIDRLKLQRFIYSRLGHRFP